MKDGRLRIAILLADLLWLPIAVFGAYFLRYEGNMTAGFTQPVPGGFALLLGVAAAGWIFLFEFMQLDCFRGGWQLPATVSKTSIAVGLQLLVMVFWAYAVQIYYSRIVLAYYALILWTGVILIRLIALGLLQSRHRRGRTHRVMLIGDGRLSHEFISRVRRHPELPYDVVGVLHPQAHAPAMNAAGNAKAITMTSLDVLKFLEQLRVQELIVLVTQPAGVELQSFLARCQAAGIRVNILPQLYELYTSRPRLIEIDGVPLISLEGPKTFWGASIVKRLFDLTLVSVLLVPAVLILVMSGSLLWIRERRLIRRELRCGREGRQFWMFRLDASREGETSTGLGRFLQRLSITELPQLWNVLMGQMSLVGPRPEDPERVRNYSDWQKQRLKVLPGMTGLAQVNGLREQHSSDQKTHYDLRYICEWTPIVDLALLVQTIWTLAARFFEGTGRIHMTAEPANPPREEQATRPASTAITDP